MLHKHGWICFIQHKETHRWRHFLLHTERRHPRTNLTLCSQLRRSLIHDWDSVLIKQLTWANLLPWKVRPSGQSSLLHIKQLFFSFLPHLKSNLNPRWRLSFQSQKEAIQGSIQHVNTSNGKKEGSVAIPHLFKKEDVCLPNNKSSTAVISSAARLIPTLIICWTEIQDAQHQPAMHRPKSYLETTAYY